MLENIQLKNFQSHAFLEIDFSKGVTTIIGPSDRGKSAILRAIRWVVLNQPAGNAFLQHGKKTVSVKLTIDGRVIERACENGVNIYRLDKEEFKAFGREVPEPIANFLQMMNLNFQGQHDAPFWFSETPGEVSRQLNQIVNLELVDQVLSKLASRLRAGRTVVTERQQRFDGAKDRRKSFSHVRHLESDFKALRQSAAVSIKTKENCSSLATRITDAVRLTRTIDHTVRPILATNLVVEKGLKAVKLGQDAGSLKILVEKGKSIVILVQSKVPKTEGLFELLLDKEESEKATGQLEGIVEQIQTTRTYVKRLHEKLELQKQDIQKLTKGKCVLCGSTLRNQ